MYDHPLKQYAEPISFVLTHLTRTTLFNRFSGDFPEPFRSFSINVIRGSGKKTYFVCRRADKELRITFGLKCIDDKLHPLRARMWTTYREMAQKRFFARNISVSTLMTHLMLHEFAHLLECVADRRIKGTVHGKDYYATLQSLYTSGLAKELLTLFEQECAQRSIPIADINQRWEAYRAEINQQIIYDWPIDAPVLLCKSNGAVVAKGRVVKNGHVRCRVTDGKRVWNWRPEYLRAASD